MLSYTFPELLYEYYDKIERELKTKLNEQIAAEEAEVAPLKETVEWAEKEERKEEILTTNPNEVSKEDREWMDKMIEEERKLYDDFGEDIEENFDGS